MDEELRQLIFEIQRLQERNDVNESSRIEIFKSLDRLFDRTLDRISPFYGRKRYREEYFDSIHRHLDQLESKISNIDFSGRECAFKGKEIIGRFPQFLTALDDIAASHSGQKTLEKGFEGWFTSGTAVVLDPYIFSNGPQDETLYCNGVVDIIGPDADRIDFYFNKKKYNKAVADKIFQGLNNLKIRTFNFYQCRNIHDRVWMHHPDTTINLSKSGWKGRVIGASINGVGKRPTYVIEMPKIDVEAYSDYVLNVQSAGDTVRTLTPP